MCVVILVINRYENQQTLLSICEYVPKQRIWLIFRYLGIEAQNVIEYFNLVSLVTISSYCKIKAKTGCNLELKSNNERYLNGQS